MNTPCFNCQPLIPLPLTKYVADFSCGDVNGDCVIDNVYLIGQKPSGPESPLWDQIELVIQDHGINQFTTIPLQANAGYNPKLFLGDFTGDKVCDIYVSIESGGSGGYGYFYIYSFLHHRVRQLFNFEEFNSRTDYRVSYRDCFAVEVANLTTGRLFGIDIHLKGAEYLLPLYDENGRLKEPVEGEVLALGELYPIDLNKDSTFELQAVQRVIGIANADTLGYVKTYLYWNGSRFEQYLQEVCVPPAN